MKKILVCPLDWGLGHATRSIPVIWELQQRGAEIFIASSGDALQLLRQEFPNIQFFELPSYRPVYPSQSLMSVKMMTQIPKFRKVVQEEHEVTERIVQESGIDIVISDNRYGCWSSKVKSIFISHQVNMLMPGGFGWASPVVNFFVRRQILKFNETWIPDQPGSGMTEPFTAKRIKNQKYVGWLSRFNSRKGVEKKFEIIGLVSGPEPQRTLFEKLLTAELKALGLKSLLVTGEPDQPYWKKEGNLEITNHLSTAELEEAILASGIVVSRSGYSTIMDLITLQKKAIFVPTPQQPEQNFFATYFKENLISYSVDQREFLLKPALEKARDFKGFGEYAADKIYLINAVDSLFK